MPRPRKCRRVCCMPGVTLYGPLSGFSEDAALIVMSVEEYESIRLIDLEGLTQEECAEQMQVARATVQNMYKEARLKIADSFVNGRIIKIEGGDFQLSDEEEKTCGCPRCRNKGE